MAEAFSTDSQHEENRLKVCIVCYGKAMHKIYQSELAIIRQYIISEYDLDNSDFPSGLCARCRLLIYNKIKGQDVNFPVVEDYDPQRPRNLRSLPCCNCKLCSIATTKLQDAVKIKPKRGRPRHAEQEECNQKLRNYKICGNCFAKIYPGCRHSKEECHSRRLKVDNLQLLLDSPKTTERLTSRLVTPGKKLATLGPKKKSIEPKRTKTQQIERLSLEGMANIQVDMNLSTRRTYQLAHEIRQKMGSRKAVEPGLKATLYEKHHQLDTFFEIRSLQFQKQNEYFNEQAIICNNVEGLIDKIIKYRGILSDSSIIKIGADGGRGFLKICITIFDKSQSDVHATFSDNGVKKIMILGIVSNKNVDENYFNLKTLWFNLKLHELQKTFTIASDYKIINMLIGIMSPAATHPCCYCDQHKKSLAKPGNYRTLGNLQQNYIKYEQGGSVYKRAMEHDNVIHMPLIKGKDDEAIFKLIPPPELHILLGTVTKMYKELEKRWPEVDQWLNMCHVQKDVTHGGSFNGNSCRLLLKNIDKLEHIIPTHCLDYIESFRTFDEVVASCFGYKRSKNYLENIENFKKAYIKLDISVTTKVHNIFYHIKDFCSLIDEGLGPYSEQASEAVHYDFALLWENFKVKDLTNVNYGDRLLAAVQYYNSEHM